MVEQRPFKALVVGSSPTQPSSLKVRFHRYFDRWGEQRVFPHAAGKRHKKLSIIAIVAILPQ